ncbi:eukaryotic translation initiation factor 4 gamma 1a [Brachionichthys hirsutus]|uniref:eukaryotic translation initiation factor 4 gamma 1a n=1 Tax=Brachionichthys hirsutus TaxID=412623 RepID=UPI003604D073
MNKPPQPIVGPTSVPNPSQSPGLTQAAYGPGQLPSLVFATPPPPQMNSAPQPRQFGAGPRTLHQQGGYRALQSFYQSRTAMPTSAPRVQTNSGPRPVGPTHVYQANSQMMVISQQQLSFASTPQGYFIPPAQYRAPYITPTQQYPVNNGTAGFYPGTTPAEYPAYEPSLTTRERRGGGGRGGGRENGRLSLHGAPLTPQRYPAGAYYPAQPQYTQSVQPTSVMINPAQQQQPAPPPQQPPAQSQAPPKRERKQIRIRDPNQGGRDITEEIMSSGRSSTTPTPPQVSIADAGPVQTNGEVIQPVSTVAEGDESTEDGETPPPPAIADMESVVESQQEMDDQITPPAEFDAQFATPACASPTLALLNEDQPSPLPQAATAALTPPPAEAEQEDAKVSDTVDASDSPSPASAAQEEPAETEETPAAPPEETQEGEQKSTDEGPNVELEEQQACAKLEPAVEVEATLDDVSQEEATTQVEDEISPPPASEQETAAPQIKTISPTATPESDPAPAETTEPLLSNGLPHDAEELSEDMTFPDTTSLKNADASQSQESTPVVKMTAPAQERVEEDDEVENSEEAPPTTARIPTEESTTMQAATFVPKKKTMKEFNKKEAIGDLLDAFTEEQDGEPASEPASTQADPPPVVPAEPAAEAADETQEDKEEKQNAELDEPKSTSESSEQKSQCEDEKVKAGNPGQKKHYDREFLLSRRFVSIGLIKPEGLPLIGEVILEKPNTTPLRPPDPSRLMNVGPDFTPSYLGNLGSRSMGGPRGPLPVPRRSLQGPRKEPRRIISSLSLNNEVQLNKAENAWKPSTKASAVTRGSEMEDDPEQAKTLALFKRLRSILNKLTPQRFQELMKQVTDLTIDTEERLKGAIDLIFEKAILEPSFSVAYANMCRCLLGLKVTIPDKPGVQVNFRKLLLNRCQKEFEKDQADDEIFDKKQKELETAKDEEERERLAAELEESRNRARSCSLGNIRFIGELFKLKMLTEAIMHDCILKLLKNHDEESLECLCRLLSTIGKDLDFERAKPRMDQYFHQMDRIIKEKKTSSRIRFMLQDVLDLKKNNWVPRRADQGPKTIEQIHKDAEMEEHREQVKVQQLISKKDGGRMGGNMGGRGPHSAAGGRPSQPQDEGWNTVPISKNRPIDTTRLSKITKPGALDFSNQLLAPGGKGMWGSWGKGSSGGTGAKPATGEPDAGRPTTSTLNRFSALQQSGSSLSSTDSDRRIPLRSSSSRERGGDRDRANRDRERLDRSEGRQGRDDGSGRNYPASKRSFSRESVERVRDGEGGRASTEPVRRVSSMIDDRGSRDRGSRDRGPNADLSVKRGDTPPLPPPTTTTPPLPKSALTEEQVEKKSNAIIEEYLHIKDLKEATECVVELDSASLLYLFVRSAVESTLERSTVAREQIGLLLQHLVKETMLPPQQYYKGLEEILEAAEDTSIDIPHIWLYLAEIITPMLHEGGIPIGQLFREISKPLVPQGRAGTLLVHILHLLCKGMTSEKVGAMWAEAGLNWREFLAEDQDVSKFVGDEKVEYTLEEEAGSKVADKKKVLTGEQISKHLERLLQDKADNQRLIDWIEANLDEEQTASNQFVRVAMTSVCQSAIICDNLYCVDGQQISLRASLLQKYLSDEHKELQALYAVQALMAHMEQPANLLRMFFDSLYDEEIIKEGAFYKWESSKDPAEQTGKGVALKSVTAFFTWLREAEEESDRD